MPNALTDQAVIESLTTILRDLLGDDDIVLGMATTRAEVKNWDSFAYVNFIVAAEIEFGIKFQVADVEAFKTVGDIVKQIQKLKS